MTDKTETLKGNSPQSPNSGTWTTDAPKVTRPEQGENPQAKTRLEQRAEKLRLRAVRPDEKAPAYSGDPLEDIEVEGDVPRRLAPEIKGIEAFADLVKHADRYALLRMACPDGFLGSLICETAGLIAPQHVVHTVQRDSYMNVFGMIVASTGGGKGNIQSATAGVIKPLIEDVDRIKRIGGVASGQGLQDAFSGPKLDEDDEQAEYLNEQMQADPDRADMYADMLRTITQRRGALALVHDSVILTYDEGKKLFDIMGHQNSVLASDFITLMTGGSLDSQRAKVDGKPNTRIALPAGAVRLCGTAGIQPAYMGPMVRDSDQGLMKRLLKLPAMCTPGEIEQIRALLADRPKAEAMLEESRTVLAEYAQRAATVGTLTLDNEVDELVREAGIRAILDEGWTKTPEGQQLTLHLAVAGVVSAMIGRTVIARDAFDFAGGFIALSLEMEERCLAYGAARDAQQREEDLKRRVAETQATDFARDTAHLDQMIAAAQEAIEKAVREAGGEWLTGTAARNACPINGERRQAFKAAYGREVHVVAIERLKSAGKLEAEPKGNGIRVRAPQK